MVREYNAESIEVLSGLEPVRKRPGMYTDTSCPNHLILEVIDNSVDEALSGHASEIKVELHKDNTISVSDNGRGMPVDIHPEEGIPGSGLVVDLLLMGTPNHASKSLEDILDEYSVILKPNPRIKEFKSDVIKEASIVDDVNDKRMFLTNKIEDEIPDQTCR